MSNDDPLDLPNLSLGKHRNAYLREWMVRNDKGRMEGDEFVPSEDNPICTHGPLGTFLIKKEWYCYKEGEGTPAEHVPWIAEMIDDFLAEKARRNKRHARNSWGRTGEMFTHVLSEFRG